MKPDFLALTREIVIAYVSHNETPAADLPGLIRSTRSALAHAMQPPVVMAPNPAVPIDQSIRRGHLVCLEDGRTFKSLTRHLRAVYGMTPDAYRAKWGLPAAYPMVAPEDAERRRAIAKASGLGQTMTQTIPDDRETAPEPTLRAPATEAPADAVVVAPAVSEPVSEAPGEVAAPAPKRKRLSLALPKAPPVAAGTDGEGAATPLRPVDAPDMRALFAMAIRKRHCVRWTYNQTEMLVAPLVLYTERDELYVDGIAKEKNGAPPRYEKLGRFKAAGLSAVSATVHPFVVGETPDPADPRYREGIIARV